jgi:hypothetical protein
MTETVSPEMVALARRLYADGATLDSILRRTGIKKLATLYRCVDGQLDDGSGTRPEPLLRRRPGVTRARPRRGTRVALITRLWRTAESQVSDIEARLAKDNPNRSEREGDVRMLAVLMRTLRDLRAFDEAERARAEKTPSQEHDEQPPQTIEELRASLQRKLETYLGPGPDADAPREPGHGRG